MSYHVSEVARKEDPGADTEEKKNYLLQTKIEIAKEKGSQITITKRTLRNKTQELTEMTRNRNELGKQNQAATAAREDNLRRTEDQTNAVKLQGD